LSGKCDGQTGLLREVLKFFFHFCESGVGMGGIKVGDEKAAGVGCDGLVQAKFRSSMAPTDPFFMLGGGVLAIADQEIGFSGKFV
jgi:hypothetical protein